MSSGLPQYAVGVEPDVWHAPRRGVALLLALFVTGLGQAYLGYWRRAVLWATLPLLGELIFTALVLRFELRTFYGWMPFVAPAAWLVPRIVAAWEVRSLPVPTAGRSGLGALAAFGLGAVIFGLTLFAFEGGHVASTVTMPWNGMQPTLLSQERVMVDMMPMSGQGGLRGQLVAFGWSSGGRVRRLLGLPNDRLELGAAGALLINGWPVPRCTLGPVKWSESVAGQVELEFLADNAYLTFWNQASATVPQAWTVPAGCAFVLPDYRNSANRDDSDSDNARSVRFDQLDGRPAFVLMGLTYDARFDWSRFGAPLDTPRLPKDLNALAARFQQCMARRPPRAETEPPAPH